MKKCPYGHENEEWRVLCKAHGCVHVFLADNPQPIATASVGRSWPVGSNADFQIDNTPIQHFYLN